MWILLFLFEKELLICREALSVCFKAMQTSSAIESCVVLPDFRALFLDLLQGTCLCKCSELFTVHFSSFFLDT